MMKKLLALLSAIVLLVALVPAASADTDLVMYRYVNTANHGVLNMREDASTDADIVCKIPYAAKVTIYDYFVGSAWAQCSYNGYYGYVMVRYLSTSKPSNPAPLPTATPSEDLYTNFEPLYYNAVVTPSTPTNFVNMRWAPSLQEKVYGRYYANSQLIILCANHTWCQVYDPQSHTFGYMMRKFLTLTTPIVWEEQGDGAMLH